MLTRRIIALSCGALGLFLPAIALAGDPEAHTAAMVKAAKQVANEDAFKNGVGAPKKDGVVQDGTFKIFTEGSEECPYTPSNPFGTGCAYATINGTAINEPDDWKCIDERQPEIMNQINSYLAPVQANFGAWLATRISEAAMVCNWNHFTNNAILPLNGNVDSTRAYDLVRAWADEIPKSIEENGATDEAGCNLETWKSYYSKTVNALHYVQDRACEHHNEGNLVCMNTDPIPLFSTTPLHDFFQGRACMEWIGNTLKGMSGKDPMYWCDEAVVQHGTRDDVSINENMYKVGTACGFPGAVNGTNLNTDARVPITSLACMGLERTFRHHCRLDTPKTLYCAGPASDHSDATNDQQYCEGERISAFGGEDFITAASTASVSTLEMAANRWAEVCKEPDDPCDPTQCATWCERSEGKTKDGGKFTGFCMNKTADETCTLHTCKCTFADACGMHGQPCCPTGDACQNPDDECTGDTGTCEEKGTDTCEGGLQNGDFSDGLNHWTLVSSRQSHVELNGVSYGCYEAQVGNPYVILDVYGTSGSVSQTFHVPADATTLSLRTWNNLDPVTVTISMNGAALDSFDPPSMQLLTDPNDLYSVGCTGNSPAEKSYDISAYAGKNATLTLSAQWTSGINGTFASFDDVKVE